MARWGALLVACALMQSAPSAQDGVNSPHSLRGSDQIPLPASTAGFVEGMKPRELRGWMKKMENELREMKRELCVKREATSVLDELQMWKNYTEEMLELRSIQENFSEFLNETTEDYATLLDNFEREQAKFEQARKDLEKTGGEIGQDVDKVFKSMEEAQAMISDYLTALEATKDDQGQVGGNDVMLDETPPKSYAPTDDLSSDR